MAESPKANLYLGVDVGGTKTLAALAEPSGRIVARERCATPREGTPEEVLSIIMQAMADLLARERVEPADLAAIGLAVPGVVDPDEGRVVVTPNMNLTGLQVVEPVRERFGAPVALGNDVNMGTLGEKWLGAAQDAQSVVGIFVGTGIGGGVIQDGKLVRGCREGAGEIGHIVMEVGGPLCGCGNRGCLEALASRSAIERDLREAIAAGKKTVLTERLDSTQGVIRSKALRRALKAQDPLVTEVMRKASEVLGYACLTVRHLLDPEVIVLGGGVIEACGKFVLPIVREVVASDALAGARPGSYVARSELGDDAVALGTIALAQQLTGQTPPRVELDRVPDYPTITYASPGQIAIGEAVYQADITIRGDGKVKLRNKQATSAESPSSHKISPEELEKVCKGHPKLVIIGMGQTGMAALTPQGEEFLRQRGIAFQSLPNPRAVKAYNRARGRKAALFHVKC